MNLILLTIAICLVVGSFCFRLLGKRKKRRKWRPIEHAEAKFMPRTDGVTAKQGAFDGQSLSAGAFIAMNSDSGGGGGGGDG